MSKYSVSIKWSDEDEGYIAYIPELEGLSAFGESYEDAITELNDALEGYLETLKAKKQVAPAPNKLISYSGQIRLRMPKTLHAKLASAAESEGVSLNTYIITLLSDTYGARNTAREIKDELSSFICDQRFNLVGGSVAQYPIAQLKRKPRSSTKVIVREV